MNFTNGGARGVGTVGRAVAFTGLLFIAFGVWRFASGPAAEDWTMGRRHRNPPAAMTPADSPAPPTGAGGTAPPEGLTRNEMLRARPYGTLFFGAILLCLGAAICAAARSMGTKAADSGDRPRGAS